jgi:ATP-binding cassette subfamily B protein
MTPSLIIRFTVDSVLDNQPVQAPGFVIRFIESMGGTTVLSRNIWICSITVVTAQALNGVFAFIRGKCTATGSANIARHLKDTLYDHLQHMPYNYHVKAQTGDLIQRCTSDVETVRRFLDGQMVEMFRTIFIVTFSMIIMSNINGFLTLMSLLLIPFIFLFSFFYFKKIRAAFTLVDEKEGELQAALQENLSGVRVVRAFGRERYEVDKFENKSSQFRDLNLKLIGHMAKFWGLSDGLCFVQVGIVLMLGIYLVTKGELSLGSLIVFYTYVSMFVFPLRQLARVLSDMGRMGVSMGRIYEIINTPAETDTPGAQAYPLAGDIVFNNVSFGYDKDKPVLNKLSFTIKQGETIAILGGTGSGKSTIMHLLLRLYDYTDGSITINGHELRDVEKNHLRSHVGMVLQEPFLYSKTIEENLLMARHDATHDDIVTATRTAAVHEVIEEFESRYDTLVGEKGVTLSGGQKQRVAIARTLLRDSDVLIFDDSLSAVDTETDAKIRFALKQRRKGVTTFIISQRITTLMQADRIFVIENGSLADSGTHDELLSREGLYKRVWNIQNMLEDEFESEVTA